MPRVMLRKKGFDPDRFFSSIHFSGDHYTAIREMLSGRCDVATVASGSYVAANQVGIRTSRVRILLISPTLPHGAYCASSRVPKRLAQQLQRLLLDLNVEQEFGREALGNDLAITGFDPVDLTAFTELEREVQHLADGARDGSVDLGDAGRDL
jgi:ABC-type phosphate/phosphonate transport system substrate-binding protein